MTQPFITKLPFVVDLSNSDLGKDLSLADPKPTAVITRATYATFLDYPTAYNCNGIKRDNSVLSVWNKCKELNIPFSVYVYFLQNKVEQQINFLIEYLKEIGLIVDGKFQGDFPISLDVEVDAITPTKLRTGQPRALVGSAWAAQVKLALDMIEDATGQKPIIYTSKSKWSFLIDLFGNPPSWTNDYYTWLAYYPDPIQYIDINKTYPISMLPKGMTLENLVLWQYFDDGRTLGYDYNDMNVGTVSFLQMIDKNAGTPVVVNDSEIVDSIMIHYKNQPPQNFIRSK